MRFSRRIMIAVTALAAACLNSFAADVGTAFTYQGVLENPPGNPITDTCAFEFALCDDAVAACAPGTVSSHPAVEVTYGVFTVPDVDFGNGACNGEARWLAIRVMCTSDAEFVALSPRVELKPAPYALALPGVHTQENSISPNIIGGHVANVVTSGIVGATIAGGGSITDGQYQHTVSGSFGTVGGGLKNVCSADLATVSGGFSNTASGIRSTVGGGDNNTASGEKSIIAGGENNSATGWLSTVGGGGNSIATNDASSVGGGYGNVASGVESTVGGGGFNTASEYHSTVPGGRDNVAGGSFSFAAGFRAKVRNAAQTGSDYGDQGTFIWADSTAADFMSTGPDQFLIRALGGVGIGTASPAAQLDVNGAARATTVEITGGSPQGYPLSAWGRNHEGQINVPTGTFTTVAAGRFHTLAIRSDGTLVGWGLNDYGQTNVPEGTFTVVDGGGEHSLAIRSDGTLVGWGNNAYGQTNVPEGTFTAIAGGWGHSLAMRTDSTLVGCGYNSEGQTNVPAGTFIAVTAGGFHSIAIRTNGTLVAWGRNDEAQTNVPAGTFTAVAAGEFHSLAIRSDGTLVCWGGNGILWNVPSGTFTAIAAGGYHNLAVRSDGTLVGWGSNLYGAIDVPTGTFTTVAGGERHSLAISSDLAPPDPALRLYADSAFKPGSNTWTIYSDRRLKKNITPLSGALDHLLQLRGVTFNWMNPASQGGITGTQMGLIADEVQRVFPQWVGRDPKGYQTLTVGGFEALTAEAMRELREEKDCEIENLKSEISDLKEMVKEIQKGNEAARQEGNKDGGK